MPPFNLTDQPRNIPVMKKRAVLGLLLGNTGMGTEATPVFVRR
jgi:hypothetical protein